MYWRLKDGGLASLCYQCFSRCLKETVNKTLIHAVFTVKMLQPIPTWTPKEGLWFSPEFTIPPWEDHGVFFLSCTGRRRFLAVQTTSLVSEIHFECKLKSFLLSIQKHRPSTLMIHFQKWCCRLHPSNSSFCRFVFPHLNIFLFECFHICLKDILVPFSGLHLKF